MENEPFKEVGIQKSDGSWCVATPEERSTTPEGSFTIDLEWEGTL